MFGAFAFYAAGTVGTSAFGIAVGVLVFFVCVLVGYERAFTLRVQAQTVLCQVAIEMNTRQMAITSQIHADETFAVARTIIRSFVERHCTRCHSSELSGAARQSAPPCHDFDSLDGILAVAVADDVDEEAASGPTPTNEAMPIGAPTPTLEERVQLGEWIACERAAM